jgi:FtsZ-interacting cell division protein YlmF
MKKKTSDKKGSKQNNIDLTEEELTKIKTISEYLFMDQYQDTCAYPRFEECFGAFCLEKSIDLTKVFKSLCGKKRKYLTFRRLIISFNQWKKNSKKSNQDFTKFMDLVYNHLLKNPNETVGNIVDKAINYNTNNSQHKKAISQFCVITDEDQNEIKGFQITYDEFFKNNLFLNKEDEKFYISLELSLVADTPTTENAEASFPNMNYRDGITHLGGTIKDGKINFLVFKCRSGKIAFVGKPSGEPFLFGNYGQQLHTIKISVKDGCLIYIEPNFIEVERHNPKVDKTSEEITENFLKQDKPIYEETILENVTNEEEVEKQILQPLMKDDRFYDKLKHTDKIGGRPFFQIYPNIHKFIVYDPMQGKINININPVDLISEASVFITNRHQILSQVKEVLKPKNFLTGLGSLIMGGNQGGGNMSPGEVLQNPASLTNFLGTMVQSVSKSAKEEGKKGIVKGLISGAVSGLGGLLSGSGNNSLPQGENPPIQGQNYEYNQPPIPNYPPMENNMNMPPYPNQMNNPPPMGGDNFTYEFNDNPPTQNDQEYSSAYLRSGKDKGKDKDEKKKDINNNPDKLKGGFKLNFGQGGLGGVFNMMNNVAQNFFGFGGSSNNMGGFGNMGSFGNMGNMGGGANMFSPFGFSQNNYYMPSNGNYYYYDDGEEQREYEERKRQAEQIQRQHEEEERKKYSEAIIKQKTQEAQNKWKNFSEKYSKDQGIFLLQTIGAVIRGLTIIKNERMGIKTNYTYEEKQKILDTLQNNKNIIYMLIKARKEAERRRQ